MLVKDAASTLIPFMRNFETCNLAQCIMDYCFPALLESKMVQNDDIALRHYSWILRIVRYVPEKDTKICLSRESYPNHQVTKGEYPRGGTQVY